MIYCDSSLLVTALTLEPATEAILDWIQRQEPGELCVSDWVNTEFSAAIAAKLRREELTVELKAEALAEWRGLLTDGLCLIHVTPEAFRLAAHYCDMRDSLLRASDALHLAVASLGGHRLATLDNRMAEAALAIGVKVAPLS